MTNKYPLTPEAHFTTEPCEGGCQITGYTGPGGGVVIPGEISGEKVKEISKDAFRECTSLTSVVIPEGVTGIGAEAFCDRPFPALRFRKGS